MYVCTRYVHMDGTIFIFGTSFGVVSIDRPLRKYICMFISIYQSSKIVGDFISMYVCMYVCMYVYLIGCLSGDQSVHSSGDLGGAILTRVDLSA